MRKPQRITLIKHENNFACLLFAAMTEGVLAAPVIPAKALRAPGKLMALMRAKNT